MVYLLWKKESFLVKHIFRQENPLPKEGGITFK